MQLREDCLISQVEQDTRLRGPEAESSPAPRAAEQLCISSVISLPPPHATLKSINVDSHPASTNDWVSTHSEDSLTSSIGYMPVQP